MEKFADYVHTCELEPFGAKLLVRVRAYRGEVAPTMIVCAPHPDSPAGPGAPLFYGELVEDVVPALGINPRAVFFWQLAGKFAPNKALSREVYWIFHSPENPGLSPALAEERFDIRRVEYVIGDRFTDLGPKPAVSNRDGEDISRERAVFLTGGQDL